MNWKWLGVFVIMLLLVVFSAQNYQVVEIRFLFWSFGTSLAVIIFLTFIVGLAAGWTVHLVLKKLK